jgi:hypothetical protein
MGRDAVIRIPSLSFTLVAIMALVVETKQDHIRQWIELKRKFSELRGFDIGRNRKAIPRTTNGDVREIIDWWDAELTRALLRDPRALDKDKASVRRWMQAKRELDSTLRRAKPQAVFRRNEWLWQEETARLAQYLEARKMVPSAVQLAVEAVKETVSERIDQAQELVSDVSKAGKAIKTGAIVLGVGVAGALISVPLLRRAARKEPNASGN